jgi:hypothetical protein
MAGGLMQLVAYGAQDVYLTGNPQITFWKVTYRRHTNFSMESIEQTFNGQADFGRRVQCTISRNGDLAYRTYLEVTLPEVNPATDIGQGSGDAQVRWLDYPGEQLVDCVEIEIGGQRVDRQYGQWMHIWNQLTLTKEQEVGYNEMIGHTVELTYLTQGVDALNKSCSSDIVAPQSCQPRNALPMTTLYVPLQFWYCRNPGLALPLIALQYHEVKINLEFNKLEDCLFVRRPGNNQNSTPKGNEKISPKNVNLVTASLFVDYIFLDTDERRRMAQNPHEYLIEQLQYNGGESVASSSNAIQLDFNHPCKELIWTVQKDSLVDNCGDMNYHYGCQHFNYTDAVDALPNSISAYTGHRDFLDRVYENGGYRASSRDKASVTRAVDTLETVIHKYYTKTADPANPIIDKYSDVGGTITDSNNNKTLSTAGYTALNTKLADQKILKANFSLHTISAAIDEIKIKINALTLTSDLDVDVISYKQATAVPPVDGSIQVQTTIGSLITAVGGDANASSLVALLPPAGNLLDKFKKQTIQLTFVLPNGNGTPANLVAVSTGNDKVIIVKNVQLDDAVIIKHYTESAKTNTTKVVTRPITIDDSLFKNSVTEIWNQLQFYKNAYEKQLNPDYIGNPSVMSTAAAQVLVESSLDMHCWGYNPVLTAKLQLNGQDRFSEREGSYFNLVQPYQHHTRKPDRGINVYSFALRPEEHQPSGTCNFSRIDNANLNLVLTSNTLTNYVSLGEVKKNDSAKIHVYAVNYNVLRIMSGMGGLAYSN